MAKNRNNSPKNSSKKAKNRTSTSAANSVKDSHAQVPDGSPGRSGPGGN